MEGPIQNRVKVVIDGAAGAGTYVLLNRLETGRHEPAIGTPLVAPHVDSEVMINQVQYLAEITDTSPIDLIFNMGGDVFIEFFDISRLSSLEETINSRIPTLRRSFPEVPILLVGTKADLRGTKNTDLFPVELGPFLARCLGAVKYMECSAKENFNVHKVFQEAVRCCLSMPNLEAIDKHLNAMMNTLSDEKCESAQYFWDIIQHNICENRLYFSPNNRFLENYLEEFKETTGLIPSGVLKFSPKDLFLYRFLETDRILLSYEISGMRFDDGESPQPTCTVWYVHSCSPDHDQIVQCRLFNIAESQENVVCSSCPVNLRFFAIDCKSIVSFLVRTEGRLKVKSLIIVNCSGKLEFSFLAKVTYLEYLVIVNTDVDLATLTFPPHHWDTMKHLVLNNCGITQATDVPPQIEKLFNLQILNLANNNFKKIPATLGFLHELHTLLIDEENVLFPPIGVLNRPLPEILSYLRELEENPVANTESKLIIVGQEGVGKSTLVKAMKEKHGFTKKEPPTDETKTDGVDISQLTLKDIQCKVYDLAGDVEYLNTHSLFLSSNTLHLVVFDLSRVIVDKGARSADNLCRLELWLETIASRDPKSKVIIVGTHADHNLVNEEILRKNRKLLADVLIKHRSSHIPRRAYLCEDDCFICNPEKCPKNLEMETLGKEDSAESTSTTTSQIPHILGYLEVSSIKKYPRSLAFRNVSVGELKSLVASSIANIMKATGTDHIPEQWLMFRENIALLLSYDDGLKAEPLMPLSEVHDMALELEIHKEERVTALLRFFHCQGTYLWYEDLPAMKDIVILDPQWLSDQLRTLISHRPVSSICNGVLHLSELSIVWNQMSKDNRRNLLALFRDVGLCFSISDTEELFPCKLPIGWPDEEMWPSMPGENQNQTSLLFEFSFIPPSFFSELTVEVNRKNGTFARNVKPLYYRFHIVYSRRDHLNAVEGKENANAGDDDACLCAHYSVDGTDLYEKENSSPAKDTNACTSTQHPPILHKVHYELTPHNNSLTVAVRGPDPPSIIPDIRSTIETVRRRRYPGITYTEKIMCPKCVMKSVKDPASFEYHIPHDGQCSRGHMELGSNQTILQGRYKPPNERRRRKDMGETLKDHFCPKLFVVLPINLHSDLSLKDRFVYSYIRDGFAVHLLCECPGQWHFVDSPGFRVGKPKEFFEKYGTRVCKALRFISTFSTPIKAAAAVDPHCKTAAAVGTGAKSVSQELESLLDSYLDKYPHLKPTLGSPEDDIDDLKSSSGLQRSDLSKFLELEANRHNFSPLVCTYIDKRDEWLWLCKEHNQMFETVKR